MSMLATQPSGNVIREVRHVARLSGKLRAENVPAAAGSCTPEQNPEDDVTLFHQERLPRTAGQDLSLQTQTESGIF